MCRVRFMEVRKQGEKKYRFESISLGFYSEDDLLKERGVRTASYVTGTNVTDVDNGRKQVHAKEIRSGAELSQPSHQTQCEL